MKFLIRDWEKGVSLHFSNELKMEAISIKRKKPVHSFSAQSNVIAEGQYLNLDDFMQGTIS